MVETDTKSTLHTFWPVLVAMAWLLWTIGSNLAFLNFAALDVAVSCYDFKHIDYQALRTATLTGKISGTTFQITPWLGLVLTIALAIHSTRKGVFLRFVLIVVLMLF